MEVFQEVKKLFPYSLTAILILAVALSGCGGTPPASFSIAESLVPGAASFPTGINDSGPACTTVNYPYYMAKYEVTYALWKEVYDWATDSARGANIYTFTNEGVMGGGYDTDGGNSAGGNQQPVTTISWQDAIVWCNALTEYYAAKGGASYKCVYYHDDNYATPIRSTGDLSIDQPYIYAAANSNTDMANCAANGFRLPTSMEWELAARYISATKFYPGNYASGADAAYDVTASADFDGDGYTHSTSDVAVYDVTSTAAVKSKSPNKLGLYNMNGNVWEWCFDKSGSERVERGGGWIGHANIMQLGFVSASDQNYASLHCGFRPVRTQ
jgi:formylglycine-generating enzyme required for sulfatase activity